MTYFLIDGTNNNKVVNEFTTIEELNAYVDNKEFNENWECDYETFQDYKDEFFVIDSIEMEQKVIEFGSSKRNYWN